MPEAVPPDALRALLDGRERFLAFLIKRLGSRAAAEEVLQESLLRAVEKAGSIRDEERAVAWFYRILRNAVADWSARRATERAREGGDVASLAESLPDELATDPAARGELCRCVTALAGALKPEYAEALRIVEIEERPVAALAESAGITDGNARVRLHRAREALRIQVERTCRSCAEHGCLDCSCRHEAGPEAP